jgi:hypothetical protein
MTLFSIAVAIGLVTSILAPITSPPLVSSAKSKGSDADFVQEPSGKEWQSEMAKLRFLFFCQHENKSKKKRTSWRSCRSAHRECISGAEIQTTSTKISILRRRLDVVGNFIKPILAIPFIGPQPEAPAFEKPEKSWRGYNRCKRHWPGVARHISWSPVRILRRTLHSRPWNHIDSLEIGTPGQ